MSSCTSSEHVYNMAYSISLVRTEGCQQKSGSVFYDPADLALDKRTNNPPGFLDSKLLVPGLITI